jgi:hypothetical protein
MAINLLPTNLVAQGPVVKIANTLKKIVIAGFSIFILAVVIIVAYYLINFFTLRSSLAKQEVLKTNIKALGQTEQKVFLIKDRLDKIKIVLGAESADKNLEKLEGFLSLISQNVIISEAQISSKNTEVSIIAKSSSALTSFMGSLMTTEVFKTINLTSFGFNPVNGYFITVEVN